MGLISRVSSRTYRQNMANRIHTVDKKIVTKNIKALDAYTKKLVISKPKKDLFADEAQKVFLQINFCMVPKLKNKSFYFPLPKSPVFNPEQTEVCVFVKDHKLTDEQKANGEKTKDKYEHRGDMRKVLKEKCGFITEVIPAA